MQENISGQSSLKLNYTQSHTADLLCHWKLICHSLIHSHRSEVNGRRKFSTVSFTFVFPCFFTCTASTQVKTYNLVFLPSMNEVLRATLQMKPLNVGWRKYFYCRLKFTKPSNLLINLKTTVGRVISSFQGVKKHLFHISPSDLDKILSCWLDSFHDTCSIMKHLVFIQHREGAFSLHMGLSFQHLASRLDSLSEPHLMNLHKLPPPAPQREFQQQSWQQPQHESVTPLISLSVISPRCYFKRESGRLITLVRCQLPNLSVGLIWR